jgi:hypothetical protein
MDDVRASLEVRARALLWCFVLSVVLLLFWGVFYMVGGAWAYGLHARWFEITRHEFDLMIYGGMGLTKVLALVFFLIPYIAIRIALRQR